MWTLWTLSCQFFLAWRNINRLEWSPLVIKFNRVPILQLLIRFIPFYTNSPILLASLLDFWFQIHLFLFSFAFQLLIPLFTMQAICKAIHRFSTVSQLLLRPISFILHYFSFRILKVSSRLHWNSQYTLQSTHP